MRSSEHAGIKKLEGMLRAINLTREETEATVMFGGKDPTDKICAELQLQLNESKVEIEERSQKLKKKPLLQKALSRLPVRSESDLLRIASSRLQRIEVGYKNSSSVRLSFREFTELAFMKLPPVPTELHRCESSAEWVVTFSLLQISDASAWHVLQYDDVEFQDWWSSRQLVSELPDYVGQQWKDMKALSGGVIMVLEYTVRSEMTGTSLDSYFDGFNRKFEEVGKSLFELIGYPEHLDSISILFGYVVPITYVALKCLERIYSSFNTHRRAGTRTPHLAANIYKRQVICINQLLDSLVVRYKDVLRKVHSSSQNVATDTSVRRRGLDASASLTHFNKGNDSHQAELALASMRVYDKDDLVDLGLREIKLLSREGRQIGFGSSSVVFERHAPNGTACYAVKEPSGRSALNHNIIWNRVGREAQIWRLLDHENILPLYGFCLLPDNLPGLVMENCRWNLKEFVQICSPITEKKKLELLRDVCSGLVYVHKQCIAHGDLRASNVLVKDNDAKNGHSAVLIDFGTAYFVDGKSDPISSTTLFETTYGQVGNPSWLAPELLRKAGSRSLEDSSGEQDRICISLAGDVYSFGCVFLEVFFGQDPYQSFHTEEEKKRRKLDGHLPATLEETNATYHPFLTSLWNPEPSHRPSAEGVLSQLDDFLKVYC